MLRTSRGRHQQSDAAKISRHGRSYARRCTSDFGATWNVGIDVVCYRDGMDSCGWHSDDTQGETLVVAVVLESLKGTRRILFRPKTPKTEEARKPGEPPKKRIKRKPGDHVRRPGRKDGAFEMRRKCPRRGETAPSRRGGNDHVAAAASLRFVGEEISRATG